MRAADSQILHFQYEDRHKGLVAGLDEVGRGPLAGPVVAAAVVIPYSKRKLPFVAEISDSKKLLKKKRETLYEYIREHCHVGVGEASVEEIDQVNILQASLLAMVRAYKNMNYECIHSLIDGNKVPRPFPCSATAIVKGDSISLSIAAASIVAKVTRDRYMSELDKLYPGYGWSTNVGYSARSHIDAIQSLGVTPHHRRSFAPVRLALESESGRAFEERT